MSHSSESMKPGNAVRFAATRKEYPIPDRKNTEEFLLDRAEPRTLDPEIVPGPSALTNLSERTTEYVDDAIQLNLVFTDGFLSFGKRIGIGRRI